MDIKFRVWDGKKMHYPTVIELCINNVNGKTSGSFPLSSGGCCTSVYVMQYIGVKDITDKDIYVGDIVKYYNKYWQVMFDNGSFLLHILTDPFLSYALVDGKFGRSFMYFPDIINKKGLIVIGNKYEKLGLINNEE